jgi:hypothetical protein
MGGVQFQVERDRVPSDCVGHGMLFLCGKKNWAQASQGSRSTNNVAIGDRFRYPNHRSRDVECLSIMFEISN